MVTVRRGAEPRARTAARPLDRSPIVLRRVSLAKGVCDARRRVASGELGPVVSRPSLVARATARYPSRDTNIRQPGWFLGDMTAMRPRRAEALEAFALLVCATSALAHQSAVVTPDRMGRADFRIAFGSCSRHDRPQDVWGAIRGVRADAFVWLGDVIYADGKLENGTRAYFGNDAHAAAFAIQNANPDYAALREETRVLGTWDDHDFGYNNAGREWEEKEFAQRVFLDFLGEPHSSPRRHREGVYESYTFRGLGARGDRSARLVLLDCRYHMSHEDGVLLGEDQWRWFERIMTGETVEDNTDVDPVDVTIIGSSIQVHADTQRMLEGIAHGVESWGQFPREKKRLMDLVERSRRRSVFLSGDVHHAEVVTSPERCELPYELVELTSSGMTHGILDEVPRKFGLRWAASLVVPDRLPTWLWPDVGTLQHERYVGHNFGEVAIDFEDEERSRGGNMPAASPVAAEDSSSPSGAAARPAHPRTDEATGSIRLNIRGKDGKVKITKTVRLKDLEGTWTDVDVAAARGEGEGAAAGRLRGRVARRRISPLCRRRDCPRSPCSRWRGSPSW